MKKEQKTLFPFPEVVWEKLVRNTVHSESEHFGISILKMQSSVNQLSVAGKRHARRQSYGKIMPISSLLNNLIGSTLASSSSDEREMRSPVVQPNNDTPLSTPSPPLSPAHVPFNPLALNNINHRVNERSDSGDGNKNGCKSTISFIEHEKAMGEQTAVPATATIITQSRSSADEPPAIAIDVDKTFLKCVKYRHSLTGDIEPLHIPPNANEDPEDDIDRVLITTDDSENESASCSICSNKASIKHNTLMSVLCKKLCDDSCNTSTKTCPSHGTDDDDDNAIAAAKSDASTVECVDEPLDMNQIDEEAADTPVATSVKRLSSSSRQEFLASMLESDDKRDQHMLDQNVKQQHSDDDDDNDECNHNESHIAPLTIENLKQFNKDYFREKLAIAEALAKASMMSSPAAKRRLAARKMEMSLNTPDFVYDPENAEYIPPKELLMYLVR